MRKKILIVVADYYKDIASNLINSAKLYLKNKSSLSINFIRVPGVFEIPVTISKNIKKFDAFIALGCVIKGQTDHYFFISQSVTSALINLSVKSKKPIGFGILTVNNYKQAKERALITKKNKGKEVALGVISILKN